MDLIAINIAGKESINLVCSKCGCGRKIKVSSLPNISKVYKIKCKCINGFSITFDKRKEKRQHSNLIGTYTCEHSITDNITNIIDVSRGGLAFIRTDRQTLKIGDCLVVRFTLDNVQRDIIECRITIKNIVNDRIGGEFLDTQSKMIQTLRFYLFNPDE